MNRQPLGTMITTTSTARAVLAILCVGCVMSAGSTIIEPRCPEHRVNSNAGLSFEQTWQFTSVYLGLILFPCDIKPLVRNWISEIVCPHARMHILVDEYRKSSTDPLCNAWLRSVGACVTWTESNFSTSARGRAMGRVPRIAALREEQRTKIRSVLRNYDQCGSPLSYVIVVDLDLATLPTIEQLNRAMAFVGEFDAVASCGLMWLDKYYDKFATILHNDTFPMSPEERVIGELGHGEMRHLVGTDGATGSLLTDYILQCKERPRKVISAFGGLTIYNASVWLDARCSYDPPMTSILMKFAIKKERRPCEHVAFHMCLGEVRGNFAIGIAGWLQPCKSKCKVNEDRTRGPLLMDGCEPDVRK